MTEASPRPWKILEHEEVAFGERIAWVDVRAADGHLLSAQCVLLALPGALERLAVYRENAVEMVYDGYRE